MSKAEILEDLSKLTKEERFEIRLKLAELDGDNWLDDDDPLSDEQKALLEARLRDMELHPETSIRWAEVERRLQMQFMKVTYSEIGPDALADIEEAAMVPSRVALRAAL